MIGSVIKSALIIKHLRTLAATFVAAVMLCCVGALTPHALHAQMWTPAGQMVGPLMWPFPLTLPDSTNLIPLRWVNSRNNDSLYWFEIESFQVQPKMYHRQTLNLRSLLEVRDYDGDGLTDVAGRGYSSPAFVLYAALTDDEHKKEPVDGQVGARWGVETRYFGDVNSDGLVDDFVWDPRFPRSAIVAFGDRQHPFMGPSYVAIRDSRNPMYPDLQPTYVAALGMLDGSPHLVQTYYANPQEKYYELLELNRDDLIARKDTIRTTVVQRAYLSGHDYGAVVLRTPGVWWLFGIDPNGSRDRGLKVTRSGMSVVTVPEYWRAYWDRFLGQGGENSESNFPRVIDADRPFIRYDRPTNVVDSIGEVKHAALTLTRLKDPETAEVEILGTAVPVRSQMQGSYLLACSVVDDIDHDGLHDMMVNFSFKPEGAVEESACVNLYLTTQRPTVSVDLLDSTAGYRVNVIDIGTAWRLVDAVSCGHVDQPVATLYDVSGTQYMVEAPRVDGRDVVIEKPKGLPQVSLWLRVGECTIRVQ